MPPSSYGLSSPHNARLSQRLAGLSQRLAARRAFAAKKPRKRPEISPNFSRQGYASDFHSRQNFLTTAAHLVRGMRSPQQALAACRAFVMLRVRDTRTVCPMRSNSRQNCESIAANLPDKSHRGEGEAKLTYAGLSDPSHVLVKTSSGTAPGCERGKRGQVSRRSTIDRLHP
jgi:hypothetical protein